MHSGPATWSATVRHAPNKAKTMINVRVSTEDWQDPVTSRARQREQAKAVMSRLRIVRAAERYPLPGLRSSR